MDSFLNSDSIPTLSEKVTKGFAPQAAGDSNADCNYRYTMGSHRNLFTKDIFYTALMPSHEDFPFFSKTDSNVS